MNTKKKIASPVILAVCLIGIGIMTAVCIGAICIGMEALTGTEAMTAAGACFAMAAMGGGFALFFLWGMNVICCVVWVEDDTLHRRGLLFGHRRSCAVKDIQRLEQISAFRGGTWIYIVDSHPGVYKNGSKHSYICLADTPANRRFITSFCGRMIRTIPHGYTP